MFSNAYYLFRLIKNNSTNVCLSKEKTIPHLRYFNKNLTLQHFRYEFLKIPKAGVEA